MAEDAEEYIECPRCFQRVKKGTSKCPACGTCLTCDM